MDKPRIGTGFLAGLLATAALIAVMALADTLLGLPFVPYDLLDWAARALPGGVVTFGIDAMVAVLNLLGLALSETAKLAEQIMAISGVLIAGVLAGGLLFAVLRALPARYGPLAGLALGLLAGLPVTLISLSVNRTATASPAASVIWLGATLLAWGAALGWVYHRLSRAARTGPPADEILSLDQLDRRRFLVRLGVGTAAVTVVGAGLAAALNRRESDLGSSAADSPEPSGAAAPVEPIASSDFTPAPGTRPELTPVGDHYRIDINARPPRIDIPSWRLAVDGLVAAPLSLSLADLRDNYEPVEQTITISCISNSVGGDLIGTQIWTGVRLLDVLADAGVKPEARYLYIRSEDGFYETLELALLEREDRIMLCYDWDGQPLTADHGAPLRIWIPDRYGMKQPKWITSLMLGDAYEAGYWVERGWDEVARVKATSVVDTVAVDSAYEQEGQLIVPVGGIAYAGARGIARVEISVDGGDWQPAALREPLSDTTWVIWRFDWLATAGEHRFRVRCVDGDGAPQIERIASPRPAGATGLHGATTAVQG